MAHVSSLAAGLLIPPTPKASSHDRRPPPPPIRSSSSSSSSSRADVMSRRSAALVFGLAGATLPLPFCPSKVRAAEEETSTVQKKVEAAEKAAGEAIAAGEETTRRAANSRPAAEASSCADHDPTSALAQARSLYDSGRLAEAEDLLMRAAAAAAAAASASSCDTESSNDQENTTVPPLLKLLGDVRVDSYRYAEAVDAYTAAIALNRRGDSAPGAHFGRANAHEGLAALAAAAATAAWAGAGAPRAAEAAADSPSSVSGLPAGVPRRRQTTMGAEERREYEAAVDDYTQCLELRPAAEDPAAANVAVFERAQVERALGRWAAARADYDAAAELFLRRRLKKEAKIAEAQAAFASFEAGDVARAMTRLESLSRQLYSSDVRAALVACYWTAGEAAKAEDQWLGLCDMEGAACSKYVDEDWLTGYRKWTPGLAESMADFLKLRSPAR